MTTNSLKIFSELKRRANFVAEALLAEQEMLKSYQGYEAEDVHRYIKGRIAGEKPVLPEMKPWRPQSDPAAGSD